MSGRRRHNFRWRASLAVLDSVARAVLDDHDVSLAAGLRLMPSSGVWAKADGSHTVRLVYRSEDRSRTRTETIRGVRLPE